MLRSISGTGTTKTEMTEWAQAMFGNSEDNIDKANRKVEEM